MHSSKCCCSFCVSSCHNSVTWFKNSYCLVLYQGGSLRRAFTPSGDRCHLCERRVYMVERVHVEGLYFHRECFHCSTCSCALRQGAHAFDSQHGLYDHTMVLIHKLLKQLTKMLIFFFVTGKLYCKLHFDRLRNVTVLRRDLSQRPVSHFGDVRLI